MANQSYRLFSVACLCVALCFVLGGCSSSDPNNKTSLSSETVTGSGNSGGTAANVAITFGSNPIANGATTTVYVVLSDSQGRRIDSTVILTSSGSGTFNAIGGTTSSSTITAATSGGSLMVTFTSSASGQVEIAATIVGSGTRSAAILSVL
jgi:hypothetical protein